VKKKYIAALAVTLVIAAVLAYAYVGSIPVLSAVIHGQTKVLSVQSQSMAPAIKQGASIVYDDTVPFSSLKIDDIIVFHGENNNMVARIIKQDGDAFQVKGDANSEPYPLNVTQDMYIGKIVRIDNPP
jgi:signal peptidase I, archaeal type